MKIYPVKLPSKLSVLTPILILLLALPGMSMGQELKVLEPEVGPPLDFSPEFWQRVDSPEAIKQCDELWDKRLKEGRWDDDYTPEEEAIFQYCNVLYGGMREGGMWDVVSDRCNWYCGGGPIEITASSYLEAQGENTYVPENAHDHNYKNAWVEGVPGYGIGESLTYVFPPESGRVTTIIVVNGYVKSPSAWENNSRVKQLKMYIDEKPYALLNLKDVRANQTFTVDPIGHSDREDFDKLRSMPQWSITFEITDVYKGCKYDDVVLTEIFFDGLDDH